MKMRRTLWRGIKPLINFPKWMGVSDIKKTTSNIAALAKAIFVPERAQRKESFKQAVNRLHLTEANIKSREKQTLTLAIIFAVLGLLLLFYAGYLAQEAHFFGALFGLIVACIAFAQAFYNHFWYFQIKHRKLGCSVREWWRFLLKGKK